MLSVFARAEYVEPAERVQRIDVLLGGRGDAVLRQQFADAAVLAFGRRAVVAPDVEDERVVAVAETVDLIDDAADLDVDVFGKAGKHLHQAALERLFVLRNAVPGRERCRPRRELRILRNPALLLGARERALAILVPAVVELAFVFVRPLLRDVVWAMAGAGRPIHEERLVGLERLLIAQPGDGVVGEVLAQVILLARRGRIGVNDGRVANKVRLVLRRLAGEEAVEVFKAIAGRPILERPRGRGVIGWCVVPLAPGRRWRSRNS